MHIGQQIKIARMMKGLTQQELADKIHKTRPLISSIEQTGKVNVYTLQQICDALETDLERLKLYSGEHPVVYAQRPGAEEELEKEVKALRNEVEKLRQQLTKCKDDMIDLLKQKISDDKPPKRTKS